MRPEQLYGGVPITPHNLPSYLSSAQLGLPSPTPRTVLDHALLSPLLCTVDDDYPAIAPNLSAPNVNPEPPTYCLRFCPVPGHHNLLGLANEDGRVAIQDTSKVLPKIPLTGFSCHDNAIFDIAWSDYNPSTMVTVSGDQKVGVWDIGEGSTGTKVRELVAHTRSVKCVEWRPGSDSQFATGGRDNSVLVWDTRDKSDRVPDNAIRGAHSVGQGGRQKKKGGGTQSSPSFSSPQGVVTALAWVDSNTLASSGDNDGVVKLWDLRKNYSLYKRDPIPKLELTHPGPSSTVGYTSLSLSPCHNYLYTACMDDTIYKYDIVNGFHEPCARYIGASIKNFFIKMAVSPCGRYLVSGSSDNWAYLWHTGSEGGPVARLGEQQAEVTCVAWSQGREGDLATLVTASDDMRHQVWRGRRDQEEQEMIRSRVEMLGKVEKKFVHSPFRPILLTPSTSNKTPRRGLLSTPGTGKKRQTPSIKFFLTPKAQLTPVPESPANVTPSNDIKRGLKRRQCDFNDENFPGQPAKMTKQDSCRNLSDSISTLYSSPVKCNFTPDSYKSPRKLLSCSPMKISTNSPLRLGSPLKLFSPMRELRTPLESLRSPTANLPNLLLDGTSPRAVKKNGKAKVEKSSNWLTSYVKEKKQVVMKEVIGGLAKQTGGFSKVKQKKEAKKSVRKIVKLK